MLPFHAEHFLCIGPPSWAAPTTDSPRHKAALHSICHLSSVPDLESTYSPPSARGLAFLDTRHVGFKVIANIAHMRNEKTERLKEMDRIIWSVESKTTHRLREPCATPRGPRAKLERGPILSISSTTVYLLVLRQSLWFNFNHLAYPLALVCARQIRHREGEVRIGHGS